MAPHSPSPHSPSLLTHRLSSLTISPHSPSPHASSLLPSLFLLRSILSVSVTALSFLLSTLGRWPSSGRAGAGRYPGPQEVPGAGLPPPDPVLAHPMVSGLPGAGSPEGEGCRMLSSPGSVGVAMVSSCPYPTSGGRRATCPHYHHHLQGSWVVHQ